MIYRLILFFAVCMVSIYGCSTLREYTGREHGAVGLRVRKFLGEGEEVKEYYATSAGDIINLGDTTSMVRGILGSPDTEDISLDGESVWLYRDRNIKLYFDNGILRKIVSIASTPSYQE